MVLVFPREILASIGEFQGYSLDVHKYLDVILNPHNNFLMDRNLAEMNPDYKQLIPYVVLQFGRSVFTYRRGRTSHENRLIGMRSIGLGGHIEETDLELPTADNSSYRSAVRREINEEVLIETSYVDNVLALINDDSDDVGRVHFGVLHVYTLAEPKVRSREDEITQASFVTIEKLKARQNEFESWSRIALLILAGKSLEATRY